MTHHVILGNGPAGIIAAETIRKHAPLDAITLIGDETEPAYSCMAIPYLLMGHIGESGTYLRQDPGHFADLNRKVLVALVHSVQAATKTIVFEGGETRAFDTLMIATGSHPVHPPDPWHPLHRWLSQRVSWGNVPCKRRKSITSKFRWSLPMIWHQSTMTT